MLGLVLGLILAAPGADVSAAPASACTYQRGSERGQVRLVSTVGAYRVSWEGTPLGVLPLGGILTLPLPQGCVELTLAPLDGRASTVIPLEVKGTELATFTLAGQPLRARSHTGLSWSSQPPPGPCVSDGGRARLEVRDVVASEVWAGGKRLGTTPLLGLKKVPSGCLDVELRPLDGGPSRWTRLELEAKGTVRLVLAKQPVPAPTRSAVSGCAAGAGLARAREALADQSYREVREQVRKVESEAEVCPAHLADAALLDAFAAAIRADPERCARVLGRARLLGADLAALDDAPEAVRACREAVGREPRGALRVAIEGAERVGDELRIAVAVEDSLDAVAGVAVYFRGAPDQPFARLRVPFHCASLAAHGKPQRTTVTIPALAAKRGEYFVVAVSGAGGWLATDGDAGAPRRLP